LDYPAESIEFSTGGLTVNKWLNYHHLYYFRTIAHEGGIAKAAQKLRLGQPTLSTQLRQLEDSLGHRLFDRRKRTLVLTEAGKVTLEYADTIFRSGDELMQVLEDGSLSGRIDVKLGALDCVPKRLLIGLIKSALAGGNCSVTLLEGRGDELFRELFAHQIDLIVCNYPPAASTLGKVFSRSIAKAPVAVFGAPKFAKLKKGFPRNLEGQPFILPTVHSKLRHDLDHYFSVNKLRVRPIAETQDTSVQKLLGIEGHGLIPLPEFSTRDLVGEKKLVKLGTLPDVKEEFWLVAAARKIENPIAAALMGSFQVVGT